MINDARCGMRGGINKHTGKLRPPGWKGGWVVISENENWPVRGGPGALFSVRGGGVELILNFDNFVFFIISIINHLI